MAEKDRGGYVARVWRSFEQPIRFLVYLLIALSLVMIYHQTEYLVNR